MPETTMGRLGSFGLDAVQSAPVRVQPSFIHSIILSGTVTNQFGAERQVVYRFGSDEVDVTDRELLIRTLRESPNSVGVVELDAHGNERKLDDAEKGALADDLEQKEWTVVVEADTWTETIEQFDAMDAEEEAQLSDEEREGRAQDEAMREWQYSAINKEREAEAGLSYEEMSERNEATFERALRLLSESSILPPGVYDMIMANLPDFYTEEVGYTYHVLDKTTGECEIHISQNVRGETERLITILHELLHNAVYKSRPEGSELPLFLNEGLTEVYARKILEEWGIPCPPLTAAYMAAQGWANALEGIVGGETLREAYFSGDLSAVGESFDQKFGDGAFDNMVRLSDRIHTDRNGDLVGPDVGDVMDYLERLMRLNWSNLIDWRNLAER